ncbi:hypothetical protein Tco_0819143 [Tanacetum coccineum]|uniref:Integrase, catalytic region, zinc finger, CCHC-type, peptidase aspartic, catalytic n=1 Tax=Tanacetum coccineum TaxID=301880 RepID=A0ABQ5AA11_9ASTR
MTTLADKSLLSGGDNKPPMLEKHLYDSWKSRMELYMMNRPHGRMILASVEKGPLVWPSITEDGVTRLKEYVELTPAEAIQADCDIKAINIILQGLPTEIYALVSQHRVAKDLWEKIKLLMQGTSLTKQERECKLYDEFDKFTHKIGESYMSILSRYRIPEFKPSALSSTNKCAYQPYDSGNAYDCDSDNDVFWIVNDVSQTEMKNNMMHCTNVNKALTTELDRYKEEVKDLKEMQNVENNFSGSNEQYAEIVRLKETLFEQVQEDSLMKNNLLITK